MSETKRVILVSVPAPAINQTDVESDYWRWHYALKIKLAFTNFTSEDLLNLGNTENQNVGLLTIANYLKSNGIDVTYLAPSLLVPEENREQHFFKMLEKKVHSINPHLIGFSASTCSIGTAMNYSERIKHLQKDTITVIGGAHASGVKKQFIAELLESFDYVVRGFGEIPLLNLINGNVNIKGLSYKSGDTIVNNGVSVVTAEDYPNSDITMLNIEKLPAARIFTSLGCRNGSKCVFCADINNQFMFSRKASHYINEMKTFQSRFGTKYFYFGDENFFFDKQRAHTVIKELAQFKNDIVIGLQSRISDCEEKELEALANLGQCTEIQFGIESGSQNILDLSNKRLIIDDALKVCRTAKSFGINTHCNFLIGLPGETYETAEQTIELMEFLLESGIVDVVEYRIVIPFPGSAMWNARKRFGVEILHTDWDKYRGENIPPFRLENLDPETMYEIYLKGLERILKAYQKRYLRDFGKVMVDTSVLSSVAENSF